MKKRTKIDRRCANRDCPMINQQDFTCPKYKNEERKSCKNFYSTLRATWILYDENDNVKEIIK